MGSPRRVLMMFAKEPDPRNVKTRLAPVYSPEQRLALYEAMVRDLWEVIQEVPADERLLYYAAPERPERLAAWIPDASLRAQAEGDLGARMTAAFREAFQLSGQATQVVLIGSDAPLIGREELEGAFAALDRAVVTIAPAVDGGYALIGLRDEALQTLDELFDGLRWSTDSVYAETLARVERTGLSFLPLPLQVDVDTPEDVVRLRALIRGRRLGKLWVPDRVESVLARW